VYGYKTSIMKIHIRLLTVSALMIGTSIMTTNARTLNLKAAGIERTEEETKLSVKIRETANAIAKDLGLSDKQTESVYKIKLEEAEKIEQARQAAEQSQRDIGNEIILIKKDADAKIRKVLNKDQVALWDAKKDKYDYNPGLIENVKDKWHEKKEQIQERREEKKSN